ncbi:MAG TPA: right-handed parallel beta-helix repeat-containing protein [Conexibacter sp.]|nr:right-handed parallel beta-helix repeat-containing protein [Conexibacter sp.]
MHDVSFQGLTFSYATWMGPDKPGGFVQHFGPVYEYGEPVDNTDPFDLTPQARTMPGNVAFHHAQRIALESDRFTRLGAVGLELSLGVSDSVVRGNVFTDVSGGGVEVGNRYPGNDDRVNRNVVVEDNWVHRIGVEYAGAVGIYAEMTQDLTLAHNQVNDVSYTGIAFGQYWLKGAPTLNRGSRVLDNRVFGTVHLLGDGGGLWSVARQDTSFATGALARGNVSYDNHGPDVYGSPSGTGFYTDDANDWITWRDNVTFDNGAGSVSGCGPLGHVRIAHNWWDNATPNFGCADVGPGVVLSDNTLLAKDDPAGACRVIRACAAILEDAGLEPAYRHLLGGR